MYWTDRVVREERLKQRVLELAKQLETVRGELKDLRVRHRKAIQKNKELNNQLVRGMFKLQRFIDRLERSKPRDFGGLGINFRFDAEEQFNEIMVILLLELTF